jgi:hypothetical protein
VALRPYLESTAIKLTDNTSLPTNKVNGIIQRIEGLLTEISLETDPTKLNALLNQLAEMAPDVYVELMKNVQFLEKLGELGVLGQSTVEVLKVWAKNDSQNGYPSYRANSIGTLIDFLERRFKGGLNKTIQGIKREIAGDPMPYGLDYANLNFVLSVLYRHKGQTRLADKAMQVFRDAMQAGRSRLHGFTGGDDDGPARRSP